MQNNLVDREDGNRNVIPGSWREGRQMMDCERVSAQNVATKEGKLLRNLLKHWANSVGSVPWQDDKI